MEPPVTGDFIFTMDGTYFQLIKQDSARDKHFVYTMNYCHGSSTTDIIMWYQSVTIHSETHGIYVHPHYCFRPEETYSKIFSAGNDTNTTKHDLPEKYSTTISDWKNEIYTLLVTKNPP